MVKNQGTKQRGQRILGNCWQWEANGQCSRGDNCSFRHDAKNEQKCHSRFLSEIFYAAGREMHRGPEVPEVKVPAVECHDGLARITSKELAITHFVENGTLQNACSTRPRVVVGSGKSAHMHTVRLMNSLAKGLK